MNVESPDDLARRLHRLTEAHRSDPAELWRRVEAGTRGTRGTRGTGAPRRALAAPRHRLWAAGLAAAAVLGVVVVAQGPRHGGDDGPAVTLDIGAAATATAQADPTGAGSPQPTASGPTPSLTASTSPSHSRVALVPAVSGAVSPAGTPAGTPPADGSGADGRSDTSPEDGSGTGGSGSSGGSAGSPAPPAPPASPAAPPAASPAAPATPASATLTISLNLLSNSGRSVSLAAPPLLDWVTVGARSDGRTVRAKRPVGGQALAVTGPGGSYRGASPFRISWSDGSPEQTHEDDTSMLAAGPLATYTITVAPSSSSRRLLVYTGGSGVVATTKVDDGSTWRSGLLVLGGAYTIAVDLPPSADQRVVRVSSLALSRTPYFGVAAVALQQL